MSDIENEDIDNRYRYDVADPHKRIFALAMQGLFEVEIGKAEAGAAALDVVPSDCPEDIREAVRQLVEGAAGELESLDDTLRRHLTCNWTVERLGAVERNILRLAVYILTHKVWDAPQHVRDLAANCAAEYSSGKSHSLVMGVIGAVGRSEQEK